MTTIQTISITLDTERYPIMEINLNDGTGDIPHQWTRTPDSYWRWEYVNERDYYTSQKCDTAFGALAYICQHWEIDINDYPDAMQTASEIDGTEDEEEWERDNA